MAKLVAFQAPDGKEIFVNTETVRAILPDASASRSRIIFGDGSDGQVTVGGSPKQCRDRMFG